jgi:Arc/MetJ-type ribon-helix-helix transcriptional regulator
MREFIERRIAESGFKSLDDYFSALIAEDESRWAHEQLDIARLRAEIQPAIEQMDRGESVPFNSTSEIMDYLDKRAAQRGSDQPR